MNDETRTARISVLDNVPVWQGSTATDAIRASVALAPRAEELGFTRYWVSEHHNTRRIASTAPAILIGQIAAATTAMRVGSGGVLLYDHAPLAVAEQFGILQALHPGRIDLGLGRSTGVTDPATAALLRGSAAEPTEQEFLRRLAELVGYFPARRGATAASPVSALAAGEHPTPVWLLGTSPNSAATAARLGLPYAYGHQLNPRATVAAMQTYRAEFRPSAQLEEPYAVLASFVIAADSDERAEQLAGPLGLGIIQARTTGRTDPFPTMETAAAHRWSAEERQLIAGHFGPQIIGGPDTVREKARALLAATGADELMAISLLQHPEDRLRSYQILAEALGVPGADREPARLVSQSRGA